MCLSCLQLFTQIQRIFNQKNTDISVGAVLIGYMQCFRVSALKPDGIQAAICAKNKLSLFSECGNVVSFFFNVRPKFFFA